MTPRFDPCVPLVLVLDDGASATERAGAEAGAESWNVVAGTKIAVASGTGVAASTPILPVHFEVAAAPSHGFFDPVADQVLVNEDLSGSSLAVTIAHEVGHSFGLVHVTGHPAVMNPGNLTVAPNASDVAALAVIWGACGAGTAN